MRNKISIVQALAALALFFIIAVHLSPGSAHAGATTKLKVVVAPYISYSPVFIALEKGYFAAQDLEVETVRFTQSSQALPALLNGDVDVIMGIIYPSHFNAMARGIPFRMVAGQGRLTQDDCSYPFMVRKDLLDEGLEISDLKGKKYALNSPSSSAAYIMDRLLGQAGLSTEDVVQVHLMTPARLDGFATGAIDISLIGEPFATRFMESGQAAVWKHSSAATPDGQNGVVSFGPSIVKENSDAGVRFLAGFLQGVRQFNQGKTAENLAIISRHTGLDEENLRKVCWPRIDSSGEINVDSILDQQSWAVEQGFLDAPATADQIFEFSFLRQALQVLETGK